MDRNYWIQNNDTHCIFWLKVSIYPYNNAVSTASSTLLRLSISPVVLPLFSLTLLFIRRHARCLRDPRCQSKFTCKTMQIGLVFFNLHIALKVSPCEPVQLSTLFRKQREKLSMSLVLLYLNMPHAFQLTTCTSEKVKMSNKTDWRRWNVFFYFFHSVTPKSLHIFTFFLHQKFPFAVKVIDPNLSII